ncbi:MAG TPA: 50S ribosomal protein L29 [Gammaproteobacteria bacterium]
MNAGELRKKTAIELQQQLLELRKELFNLRIQSTTTQTAKPHAPGKARKQIARIKTVLNEKAAGKNAE